MKRRPIWLIALLLAIGVAGCERVVVIFSFDGGAVDTGRGSGDGPDGGSTTVDAPFFPIDARSGPLDAPFAVDVPSMPPG